MNSAMKLDQKQIGLEDVRQLLRGQYGELLNQYTYGYSGSPARFKRSFINAHPPIRHEEGKVYGYITEVKDFWFGSKEDNPLRMSDLTPEEMVQFLKDLSQNQEDENKRNTLLQIATYVNACNILVMKRNGLKSDKEE